MSEMSYSNSEDKGVNETGALSEGLSPGRCSSVRQGVSGRYQASAKMKWNKGLNVTVMECYFLSKPIDENGRPVRGYRGRIHKILKERELPTVTEQRLCDRARALRKNEWFTVVELEEIRRRLEVDNDTEERNDSNTHLRETEVQEHGQTEERTVQINRTDEQSEQESCMIEEIVEIMRSGQVCDTRGLKKVNRNILSEWTGKVNKIIRKIRTENLTDTNKLIGAVAIYISKKVELKTGNARRNAKKEPWWKRRITIEELRKHVNILQRNKRGELTRKKRYNELERKYHIKNIGENVVIEELKQRLQAKAAKLERFEQRVNQFRINRLFQQDQKKVQWTRIKADTV